MQGSKLKPPKPSTAISLLRWCAAGFVSVIVLGSGLIIALFSQHNALKFRNVWAKMLLWVFDIQVDVVDENNGAYDYKGILFVGLNQSSLTEPLFSSAMLPTQTLYISNIEFALIPFVGWIQIFTGGLVLIRQWPSQARRVLKRAEAKLTTSSNIWISIEGKRSKDGSLSPYKKGAAVLAIQAQSKIVPVLFQGARDRLPYGDWRVHPGRVTMTLKRFVYTNGLTYENRDTLTKSLRELAEASTS